MSISGVGVRVTVLLFEDTEEIDGTIREEWPDGLSVWTWDGERFYRWVDIRDVVWADEECRAWRRMIARLLRQYRQRAPPVVA